MVYINNISQVEYLEHHARSISPSIHHSASESFLTVLQAFAEALMVIPKVLAQNSGFDPQDTTIKLQVGCREGEVIAPLCIQRTSIAVLMVVGCPFRRNLFALDSQLVWICQLVRNITSVSNTT